MKPGILEKGILLRIRFELEQYINLRPVKLYDERFCPLKDKKPEDIDFVVVRENNEGLYTGVGRVHLQGHAERGRHPGKRQHPARRRALPALCVRARPQAPAEPKDSTRDPARSQLTLCGKTNVLTYAFDLWERAFHEIGAEGLSRTSSATTPTWTRRRCGS